MPNICENRMTISHPDITRLQDAVDAWNKGALLSTLIPEPDYTKVKVKSLFGRGYANRDNAWCDWRCQNWGTKWDVWGLDFTDRRKRPKHKTVLEFNFFTVSFFSAWCPPIQAYEKLTAMGFQINASYENIESGCRGTWDSETGDKCYAMEIE